MDSGHAKQKSAEVEEASSDESSSVSRHDELDFSLEEDSEEVEKAPRRQATSQEFDPLGVDYYESYMREGLAAEDTRALYEGFGGYSHFNGHATSLPEDAIAITLYMKGMGRKQKRSTRTTSLMMGLFRYAPIGKDGRASETEKQQRGALVNQPVRADTFSHDIDMYSQYNSWGVFGFDVSELLSALSVSETTASSLKKKSAADDKKKNAPLAIRSCQVLRGPLRLFPISFTAMYPLGRQDKVVSHALDGEGAAGRIDDDVVFTNLTEADYQAANSDRNSNNAAHMSRSVIKNRCLPVYMLPLLLAGQSSSLLACGNSPINISYRLLAMMKQKRSMYLRHRREYDHCIMQLEANIAVTVTVMERYASMGRDILSRGTTMLATFDNLTERMQSYDQALYEKTMTDRSIVSTVKFSAATAMEAPNVVTSARAVLSDTALPVIEASYEKTERLYVFFDVFLDLYDARMGIDSANVARLRFRRVAFFDEYMRFMSMGMRVNYISEEIIHAFRRYMRGKDLIDDDIALAYFNELEEAYAKRLYRLGVAHDEGLVGDVIKDSVRSLAIFMENERRLVAGKDDEEHRLAPGPGIQRRTYIVPADQDDEEVEEKAVVPPTPTVQLGFGDEEDEGTGFIIQDSPPLATPKKRKREEQSSVEMTHSTKKNKKARTEKKAPTSALGKMDAAASGFVIDEGDDAWD